MSQSIVMKSEAARGGVFASLVAALSKAFRTGADANGHLTEYRRLSRWSETDLAKAGLSRGDILAHVMAVKHV